jgi:hypothetical protein
MVTLELMLYLTRIDIYRNPPPPLPLPSRFQDDLKIQTASASRYSDKGRVEGDPL